MRNMTTYTSEEVVEALMRYHTSRMPFDGKRFEVWPSGRLEEDGGWTVVTEEKPVVAKVALRDRIKEITLWVRGWVV
jgi:hypothetical protein